MFCFLNFVTNLSQESLCLLLTSLLASAVFRLYSSFFEFSHFLYDVFFVSINCFIWSSHIFKYFLLFRFLLFLNFHLLPILLCFVSFSILSQCLFHSPSLLFKWIFTLWVYTHFMLSSFSNITLNNSSCFHGTFWCSCLTIVVENLLLHIVSNGHYIFHYFCKL